MVQWTVDPAKILMWGNESEWLDWLDFKHLFLLFLQTEWRQKLPVQQGGVTLVDPKEKQLLLCVNFDQLFKQLDHWPQWLFGCWPLTRHVTLSDCLQLYSCNSFHTVVQQSTEWNSIIDCILLSSDHALPNCSCGCHYRFYGSDSTLFNTCGRS